MRIFSILILLIASQVVIAQPSINKEVADSLWSVWKNEKLPEINRYNAIHEYAWSGYIFTQPDSALIYAKLEYDFAKKHRLKKEMAFALNTQAFALSLLGNHNKSIETYIKSLKIHELIGYKEGEAGAFNNIGIIYENQGDYQKAIKYYNKSLIIDKEIDNLEGVAISYINIGIIYRNQGHYEKAIDYLTKSLNINKNINELQGVARSLVSIGVVYLNQGNYNKAIENLRKSLNIFKNINDKQGVAYSLLNIGNVNQKLGKYSEALKQTNKSLILAEEVGSLIEIRDAAESLWKINKKLNNFQSALKMYELFVKTKDSIQSEKNQRAVIQQEYKYKYEKEAALDSLKYAKEQKLAQAESAQKDAEIRAKRNEQYALFGGLGLTLLFAGFMYNRFRVTHQQKVIIEQQKDEVDIQKTEAERQRQIVEEKNTEILNSIDTAKRLRASILPPVKLVKEHFEESFVIFKSKEIVNGNFYWMEARENLIMFAVAAYTGNSASGAMVSVSCVSSLNKAVKELNKTDPADILNTTFKLMKTTFSKSDIKTREDMNVTLCVLNETTETLDWAGAKNPLWVVKHSKANIEETQPGDHPSNNSKPFTTHRIKISGGDSVYMFSNGQTNQLIEEKGSRNESKELKKLLLDLRNQNMSTQKKALNKAFESWQEGLKQLENFCMIGVRLPIKENNPFTRREKEVLQLLDQGQSSKIIADELNISKSTVDTHRKNLLKKVEVNSVTELLRVSRENDWL
jgi:tetratricopeptide (TPR) repeat protein/DNA-binding CsgD family transcriptional regulator